MMNARHIIGRSHVCSSLAAARRLTIPLPSPQTRAPGPSELQRVWAGPPASAARSAAKACVRPAVDGDLALWSRASQNPEKGPSGAVEGQSDAEQRLHHSGARGHVRL